MRKINWNVWTSIGCSITAGIASLSCSQQAHEKPNVIVILTDDQGYGDLSCHGNPYVKTPNLDKLHSESIRLTDFHVAPMSSPTRGQLLTGVDCIRNGCMATCAGRSTVDEKYPMIGEFFSAAGYATGIFGKWHVGYNWPHRPMDRGFQECFFFDGFGLTGMGHHWNSDYYDPFYYHNDTLKQGKGYCDDIWFGEAMGWMKKQADAQKPFFVYLPTNLPHFPDWIDSAWAEPYKGCGAESFYGMISKFDENMGKLEAFLQKNNLKENTILVYLSDNGTVQSKVFNAGMTGGKCTRTEGGHRVPCFIRWPNGKLIDACDISVPTQVQDIVPTLLDLCTIPNHLNATFDGISIANLLHGKELEDRMFVIQYFQNSIQKNDAAIVWKNWRLLPMYGDQLFDISTDLAQKNDVSKEHPEIIEKMKVHYDQWWKEIEPHTNYLVPTHIAPSKQKEIKLCSSNWVEVRADGNHSARQPKPEFAQGGKWNIVVDEPGSYIIEISRWPREANAAINDSLPAFIPRFGKPEPAGVALAVEFAHLNLYEKEQKTIVKNTDKSIVFEAELMEGKTQLHAWFSDKKDEPITGAFYVYINKK